tara:strand:+ start:4400 stop:4753 length:354 start_codon:yes stop_codon:yes gene_type:complete
MSTITQVRNRAAGMLGRYRSGQAINNQLKLDLDQAYAEVYADLKNDRLSIWSSAANTEIPDDVTPWVAALMAFNATDIYGVSEERFGRIVAKRNIAKREIRRVVTPDFESLDDQTDY